MISSRFGNVGIKLEKRQKIFLMKNAALNRRKTTWCEIFTPFWWKMVENFTQLVENFTHLVENFTPIFGVKILHQVVFPLALN